MRYIIDNRIQKSRILSEQNAIEGKKCNAKRNGCKCDVLPFVLLEVWGEVWAYVMPTDG